MLVFVRRTQTSCIEFNQLFHTQQPSLFVNILNAPVDIDS